MSTPVRCETGDRKILFTRDVRNRLLVLSALFVRYERCHSRFCQVIIIMGDEPRPVFFQCMRQQDFCIQSVNRCCLEYPCNRHACMLHQMTRIGIDCRFASARWVWYHTREFVTALVARNDPWTYVLFVSSPDKVWHQHLSCEKLSYPTGITHFQQIFLPDSTEQSHIDVHCLRCTSALSLSRIGLSVQIHDLILHHYPNCASLIKRIAYRMLFAHAVNQRSYSLSVMKPQKPI